jgi:hypothetical protein
MYIGEIIYKLQKKAIRFHNTDYYPVELVHDMLNYISERCIAWDEDDFKQVAIDKTNETDWNIYYDESRFNQALKEMIDHHDATIGINWETVKYYLDEYCKLKDYKNIYDDKSK